jgi:DNA polymerase-3 subunit alpha
MRDIEPADDCDPRCHRLTLRVTPRGVEVRSGRGDSELITATEAEEFAERVAALKGVGYAAMTELSKEREARGEFKDLDDLAKRLDAKAMNKRQMESLIAAGALDGLHKNRAQLFTQVDRLLRTAQASRAEQESNQVNIFAVMGEAEKSTLKFDNKPDWPPMERLAMEFGAVGYYLSAHPLDSYKGLLRRLGVTAAGDLQATVMEKKNASRLSLCGVVITKKERKSQKGNKYAFVGFSDATGSFEVTLFSEILTSARELLESGKPLLVAVEPQIDGEAFRLTAQSIKDLDAVARDHAGSMNIVIEEQGVIEEIAQILTQNKATSPKPNFSAKKSVLTLSLLTDEEEIEIALPNYPVPVGAVKLQIADMPGVNIEEI